MNSLETIKLTGNLTIVKTNEVSGQVEETNINNLVVTAGKNYVASRMVGVTEPVMSHIAVGTGTTSSAAADTTLESELSRVALTSSVAMMSTVTYVTTFPAGIGTGALTEAGIFNDATMGVMLARTTFAVINKGVNDSITITWNVSVA